MSTNSACLQMLSSFVGRRCIDIPDGRPICAYRGTAEEFRSIGETVRSRCTGATRATRLPIGASALFCLYAAEWWRRNHEGGAWRWEEILTSSGLDHLPLLELYEVVQQGLKYWKRPLLLNNASRMFLVTLACEGGLPLNLLRRDFGRLGAYFRGLLEQFELYRDAGFAPERLARIAGDRLPRTLRQEVVFQISGQLVDVIWQRRSAVKGAADPLRALDESDASWREALPLSLDDAIAEELLKRLVADASQVVRHASARLKVGREVVKAAGGWRLRMSIELPGWVSKAWLQARATGLDVELGGRFELYATVAGGASSLLSLATARAQDGQDGYLLERPRRDPFRAHDEIAAAAVGVQLCAGTELLLVLDTESSEGLSELPWVFADRRGDALQYSFVGEGTLRTRYDQVLLAVPLSTEVESLPGGDVQPMGELKALERRLVQVRGGAVALDGNERCEVHTGAESDDIPQYGFFGNSAGYRGEGGVATYRGWPRLVRKIGDATPIAIPLPSLQLRRTGSRDWEAGNADRLGLLDVRHVEDGALRFRSRIAVLPPRFSVHFRTHAGGRAGDLLLSGTADAEISWPPIDGARIALSVAEGDEDARISCRVEGEPPAEVRIALGWDGAEPVWVPLPFPCSGGRFVWVHGNALPNFAVIALDELGLVRATAISPMLNDRFSVRGSLRAHDMPHELAKKVWIEAPLRRTDEGRFDLSLGVLREPLRQMLTATRDPEAEMRLTIDGATVGRQVLTVRRFAFGFSLDASSEVVWLDAGTRDVQDDKMVRELVVEARPLWRPSSDPVVLESIRSEEAELNGWHLSLDDEEPGPWLLSGWQGDLCKVQPRLVESDDGASVDYADDATLCLTDMVQIGNRPRRLKALEAKLDMLAASPGDPDWEALLDYLHHYHGFPPSTIDVVNTLTKCPRTAAMALMMSDETHFDAIWEALEELPFAWWTVPIDDWMVAARRLHGHYREQLSMLGEDAEDASIRAFGTFFARSTENAEFMQVLGEAIPADVFERNAPMLGLAGTPEGVVIFGGQRDAAHQDLIRARSEEHWPQGSRVLGWLEDHEAIVPGSLAGLWHTPPQGTGFRSAVLNAPVVAAVAAVLGIRHDATLIFELKSLRAFDPRWFDEAYRATLVLALGTHWMHKDSFR